MPPFSSPTGSSVSGSCTQPDSESETNSVLGLQTPEKVVPPLKIKLSGLMGVEKEKKKHKHACKFSRWFSRSLAMYVHSFLFVKLRSLVTYILLCFAPAHPDPDFLLCPQQYVHIDCHLTSSSCLNFSSEAQNVQQAAIP